MGKWNKVNAFIRSLFSITMLLNKEIINRCSQYSMISDRSFCELIKIVRSLEKNSVEGVFVECGVWKGGACMALALAQLKFSTPKREIWLYDTFKGMTRPQLEYDGSKAVKKYG